AKFAHGTLTPNPSPSLRLSSTSLTTSRSGYGAGSNVFNRQTANLYIGNKTPFLKGLFDTVITTNIMPQIDWAIDNLIELFAKIDMGNILENFGQSTKREDPVIHFYETFLGAYSADLRKSRGVYYTPEPVVYFMVKAVNNILDQDFDVLDGLGHRDVTILDPATGTGTFLYQVIKQICNNYYQYSPTKWNHNWSKYFKDRKVLERLFGFELLMTPYTIAHLKLQLLLENLGYQFTENERLNIFLTNALDEGLKKSEVLLGEYIAQEANAAAQVKKETKIIVILGNPPYSGHSANKNSWINNFVKDYYTVDGLPLDEKNPKWLQDDYVKFIRFAQLKLDKVEGGILAFITNHGYLDNPTFRGMRQNLMQSFSRIYIINLHGNIKKKEVCPDGSKDENVFDIQQGVSILIAIKDISKENLNFFVKFNPNFQTPAQGIYYFDLWGKRTIKYEFLQNNDFHNIEWEKINPVSPFYLFTPQDDILREEYNQYEKITDIMPVNVLGFQTHRDDFAIDFDRDKLYQRIAEMRDLSISDQEYLDKYNLKESQNWKISKVRKAIQNDPQWEKPIIDCLYRPFDLRSCYFSSLIMDRPRRELINHVMGKDNLCLLTSRQQSTIGFRHCWVADKLAESCVISTTSREGNQVFPLYIYPDTQDGQANLMTEKEANFSPQFLTKITEKLGYTPSPEQIFYYIYAVFHSPNYRERYAPFLKIDFPRVPLTSNNEKFTQLAQKGEELVNL
ncbi:MAG TPA: type ISP restriction/modification enzyme, partial [Allocoleopsis sp.]